MSEEIPVGSPPAPPGRHAAPGGWYADPVDEARERYWDGWQWSRQTREAEARHGRTRPVAAEPTPAPAGQNAPGARGAGNPPEVQVGGDGRPVAQTMTADGVRLAGWWHRAGAILIDWLLVGLIINLSLMSIYLRVSERLQPLMEQMFTEALEGRAVTPLNVAEVMSAQEQLIISMVTVGIGLCYNALLLKWRGATVGKMITGLRVVPTGEGRAVPGLTWRAAVLRAVIWVVPAQHACLLPVRVIDVVMPVRHPLRQALHDMVAGTQVIRSR
ncbi:RDD family protein [Propionibacteriaceae bacterium Y2011]|uniref:RDD family protein n=1 Tax=Microlunatus sp. Y2014 TaxID=3418488 RepID=UPI003B4AA782